MFTIGIILHPTDFSPSANNAFQLACSLARDHGARLIVVHVQPPECSPKALQADLEKIRPADSTVRVEYRLEEGDPAGAILRVADESRCDLIVMGSHGKSWLERMLLGGVAVTVLRNATCPVLSVKTPSPPTEPSHTAVRPDEGAK